MAIVYQRFIDLWKERYATLTIEALEQELERVGMIQNDADRQSLDLKEQIHEEHLSELQYSLIGRERARMSSRSKECSCQLDILFGLLKSHIPAFRKAWHKKYKHFSIEALEQEQETIQQEINKISEQLSSARQFVAVEGCHHPKFVLLKWQHIKTAAQARTVAHCLVNAIEELRSCDWGKEVADIKAERDSLRQKCSNLAGTVKSLESALSKKQEVKFFRQMRAAREFLLFETLRVLRDELQPISEGEVHEWLSKAVQAYSCHPKAPNAIVSAENLQPLIDYVFNLLLMDEADQSNCEMPQSLSQYGERLSI